MENNPIIQTDAPPRLINTITEGFNVVANRIYLILFPLILDIFLWLGPHFRVKALIEPFIQNVLSDMPELATNADLAEMSKWSKELWDVLLSHFNLVSLLRAVPIGVPSLMSSLSPIETPFGNASTIELTNFFQVFLFWGALSLLGLILGCLYFDAIARATSKNNRIFSLNGSINAVVQIFIFTIACIAAFFIFLFPTMLVVTVLSLISASLGQIVLLLFFLVMIWFLMPLIFSPHGVFVEHQTIGKSITTSVRLVRNYLPGTGLFILTAILLYQGLNLLWGNAPDTSWLTIFGIFGHAFISTGLIAASFVYYRRGMAWMENKIRQAALQS
jgi:hypothetical protein